MATNTVTDREQRVITLLRMIREQDREAILTCLPDPLRNLLNEKIQSESWVRPSSKKQLQILEEFESLLAIALKLAGPRLNAEQKKGPEIFKIVRPESDDPIYELSGDPLLDLEYMNLHQVAAVLEEEQPRTVALICQHLSPKRIANVLNELTEHQRAAVVRELANNPHAPAELIHRLTETTVQQACLKSPRKAEAVNPILRLADVLRESEKSLRREFLSAIEVHDSEQARQLQRYLYRFDDLIDLTDRQVQQVLTRVDSETLQTALAEAPPEILEKVLKNLSRRAAATLQEELSYQRPIPDSTRNTARETIAHAIGLIEEEATP